MIDRSLTVAGLGLAVISPVLGIMFPDMSKRVAWIGFIVGLLLLGAAGGLLLIPVDAQSPAGGIVAPNNAGIITNGQTGGNNTIIQKDNSPRRKMWDLFNRIDPSILGAVEEGQSKLRVRMQPFQIEELQTLVNKAGPASDVSIDGFGRTFINSVIDNGTFGTAQAAHEQREVLLTIRPSILLQKNP